MPLRGSEECLAINIDRLALLTPLDAAKEIGEVDRSEEEIKLYTLTVVMGKGRQGSGCYPSI